MQLDWILVRWHLDRELSFVVSTWGSNELLKFVLIFEGVLLVLVLNREKRIALEDSVFID